jgi:hypothetical protein
MRYMLLINGPAQQDEGWTPADLEARAAEYMKFTQEIIDSGELQSGERLRDADTATTVRVRNGDVITTDGPFAETKEVLGGYYVVDCKDLDRAIELAAKLPNARTGSIEVRPVWDM